MPGPTWPNRFFVHSGTSLGHVDMPEGIFHPNLHLYNQETVYDRLGDAGKSWAIYYGDVPQTLTMTHMLKYPFKFHKMPQFFTDARGSEANFPNYSFIEPTYFGSGQNDEHPPSDILRGEVLLAQVYNAIRNNEALWEKTLLVVLYDEHGGFYDHVTPPACVAPDGNTSEFSFAQYGLRVPAVLISPWLETQVLSDVLDHTSLLRYATDKWGLGPLGARTAAAKSFASSWKVAGCGENGCSGKYSGADDAAESGGGGIESEPACSCGLQPVPGDEDDGAGAEDGTGGGEGDDAGDWEAGAVVVGGGSPWRGGGGAGGPVL